MTMEKKEILKEFKLINLKEELLKVSSTPKIQNVILTELRRFIRQIFFYDLKEGIFYMNNLTSKTIQDSVNQGFFTKNLSNECEVNFTKEFEDFLKKLLNILFEEKYKQKGELKQNSIIIKLLNIVNNQILTLINYNKLISEKLKLTTNDFNFYKVDKSTLTPEEIQEFLQKGDLREIIIVEKEK